VNTTAALWIGFNLFVVAMLALDLGVFNRKEHVTTPKEAGVWTCVWVTLSLLFCAGIWHYQGPVVGMQWLTAYVVEYALSVDNLFVFLMVFSYFRVEPVHQHRVLYWGILGAFVMRATLIILGASLVSRFNWLIYLFGAFLVFTAVKMFFQGDEEVDPEQQAIVRWSRRMLPVARQGEGNRFFLREDGRLKVTPLFIVLLVVEATDLLFALDSIPAVLGISQDSFIIYTSNVCAILGLRSLFFVVASLMDKFHFLKVGLSAILGFVGVKMLITYFHLHVPIGWSLATIVGVLLVSIVASLLWPKVPEPGVDPESSGR
jgi:tellurite resistance protein TerC